MDTVNLWRGETDPAVAKLAGVPPKSDGTSRQIPMIVIMDTNYGLLAVVDMQGMLDTEGAEGLMWGGGSRST